MCLNIEIFKCFVSNTTNISNFHPLEVVCRGRSTQLQVGENLNKLAVIGVLTNYPLKHTPQYSQQTRDTELMLILY